MSDSNNGTLTSGGVDNVFSSTPLAYVIAIMIVLMFVWNVVQAYDWIREWRDASSEAAARDAKHATIVTPLANIERALSTLAITLGETHHDTQALPAMLVALRELLLSVQSELCRFVSNQTTRQLSDLTDSLRNWEHEQRRHSVQLQPRAPPPPPVPRRSNTPPTSLPPPAKTRRFASDTPKYSPRPRPSILVSRYPTDMNKRENQRPPYDVVHDDDDDGNEN